MMCIIEYNGLGSDKSIEKSNENICLVETAVSLENQDVTFYPFDLRKYNNMGSSSMFKIDFSLRDANDPDYRRENPQKEITVKGTSGIMFSPESGKIPAEILKAFRKGAVVKLPVLKGASIDGGFYYGDQSIDILTNLKSKNELIGDVISLLQSPAKNVISALMNGGNTIAGIVKTLSERTQ